MDSERLVEATSLLLYLSLTVVFFLPVVLNPDNVFLGSFGDIGIIMKTPVYLHYNWEHGIQSTHTELLNAPFGSDISQYGNFFFFIIFLIVPLGLAIGQLQAFNLVMFFAPFLSAMAMYFLARHFIQSRRACFISGLVFGFSPYILARVIANHIHLVYGAWLAFFVLALFRFNEKKNLLNALLLAFSLALVGFFSYYYLYFALIFAAIFYIYKFWKKRNALKPQAKQVIKNPVGFIKQQKYYFIAAAVFLIVFLLTVFPLFLTIISNSEATFRAALGGRTNLMNAVYLSAWPHHFVMPSVYHPLFKSFVSEFYRRTLIGMSFTAASVFIGFTALALSLIAIFKQKKNRAMQFFLFAAIAVFILSIGPFVRYVPFFGLTLTVVPALLCLYSYYANHKTWAKAFAVVFVLLLFFPLLYPLLPIVQGFAADVTGLEQLKTASVNEVVEHLEKYNFLPIPMPSLFLFLATRVFRSLSRLSIILMMCIAVLAGLGLQWLLLKVHGNVKKNAVTLLVFALILFEVINFSPYMVTDVSETPPEYEWLALQPGKPIVLEYPLEWNNFYLFYQLRHMKPLMNGQYSSEFDELRRHILDPTDSEVLSILSGFGVKYIITHDDYFLSLFPDSWPERKIVLEWMSGDESIPFARKLDETHESIQGLRLVKEFPHARVYEVVAEPKRFDFNLG